DLGDLDGAHQILVLGRDLRGDAVLHRLEGEQEQRRAAGDHLGHEEERALARLVVAELAVAERHEVADRGRLGDRAGDYHLARRLVLVRLGLLLLALELLELLAQLPLHPLEERVDLGGLDRRVELLLRIEVKEGDELLARLVAPVEEELGHAEQVVRLLELVIVAQERARVELGRQRVDDLLVLPALELAARARQLLRRVGRGSPRHEEQPQGNQSSHFTSAGWPGTTSTVFFWMRPSTTNSTTTCLRDALKSTIGSGAPESVA